MKRNNPFLNMFLIIFSFSMVVGIGAVVFHLLEGWSMSASVYLVTNLGSTIGFGDVMPTSSTAKIFCMIYTIISIPFFLFASYKYSMTLVEVVDKTVGGLEGNLDYRQKTTYKKFV